MQDNHYRLLDVPFSASRKEIVTAYRKKMREWHPDQFRGEDKSLAEEYSKRLNLAFSVLTNAHKREEYDRSIRIETMQAQIMDRYVAGFSSWNLGGDAPAAAPKRSMSASERREVQRSGRSAARSLFVVFGFLCIGGIVLAWIFALLDAIFRVFT